MNGPFTWELQPYMAVFEWMVFTCSQLTKLTRLLILRLAISPCLPAASCPVSPWPGCSCCCSCCPPLQAGKNPRLLQSGNHCLTITTTIQRLHCTPLINYFRILIQNGCTFHFTVQGHCSENDRVSEMMFFSGLQQAILLIFHANWQAKRTTLFLREFLHWSFSLKGKQD